MTDKNDETWARGLSNREVATALRNSMEFSQQHQLPKMTAILAEAARRIEDKPPMVIGDDYAIEGETNPNGVNRWTYRGMDGGRHKFEHLNVRQFAWVALGAEYRLTRTHRNTTT